MLRIIQAALFVIALALVTSPPKRAAAQTIGFVGIQITKADGADADTIRGLEDSLAAYVTMLGYQLVNSNTLEAPQAQNLAQSYQACQASDCLAAIGKTLAAQQLLVTSLSKTSTAYALNMSLLNTETGQLDAKFFRSIPTLEKLKQTMERGVLVLFGWEKDESGVGVLSVKTTPPNATVNVDGQTVGTSPITIRSVPIGEHTVTATLKNYVAEQSITIEDGQVFELALNIDIPPPPEPEPEAIQLKVHSKPSGAMVYLDGVVVGIAPCIINSISPGEHQLEFELNKYQDRVETIEVVRPKDGKPIVYQVELEPKPATILLLGTPDDTTATLQSAPDSQQPVEACNWLAGLCSAQLSVPPGKHRVILKSPRYYAKELVFDAGPGAELEFNIKMSVLPLVRFYFPNDEPPEDLKILVDGKPMTLLWNSTFLGAKTDPFVALEHGSYELVITGKGLKRYRERLIIHDVYSPNPEITLEAARP